MTFAQHRAPTPGRRRALLAPLVAVGLFLAVIGSAAAYFTAAGTGTATGTVGTLNPPTGVTAELQPSGTDVALAWTASTGSVQPTGYLVERVPSGAGAAVAVCNTTPAAPTSATSCTDESVEAGTYTYRVTAIFRTWTAAATASAPVTVVAPAGRGAETETDTEKSSQKIEFSSTPQQPTVSDSYPVTASGGASGKPVTFSSGTPDVCTVASDIVHFVGAGLCTVEADQDGNAEYDPAPQARQSFQVDKAPQTVVFETAAPDSATVGGSYRPRASGGESGKPVVLTVDSSSADVCSISDGKVSYLAAGTCTVNADQAGSSDYLAADRTVQSFAVTAVDGAPAP